MLVLEVTGYIGADAVMKEFGGKKFMAFSIAHTDSYKDAQGQKQERTTWVSCLKYGESALLKYLKKGTHLFIRGDLSAKIYESNGGPQVGLNCRVKELQFLSNKADIQQPEQIQENQQTTVHSDYSENDDLPF